MAHMPPFAQGRFRLTVWFLLVLLLATLAPQGSVRAESPGGVAPAAVTDIGLEWTSRPTGSAQWLRAVTAGGGQVVVVGDKGTILTSADGGAWQSRQSGTPRNLTAITYAGGRFVAIGQEGVTVTSTDGVTWSAGSAGVSAQLLRIAYGSSRFVAVGDGGKIVTTENGVNWTERSSGTTERLYSVAYGGGLFVAVGTKGTILTSPDGTTWTARTSGTSSYLSGIAYGGGLFLAVGQDDLVLTSPDGLAWKSYRAGDKNYGLWSVAYGDGLFVAVGGAGNILGTRTGETWMRHDTGRTYSFLDGIGYVGGQFVAVGNSGTIRTSGSAALQPGKGNQEPLPAPQPTTPVQPAPTTGAGGGERAFSDNATGKVIPFTDNATVAQLLKRCDAGLVNGPRTPRDVGGVKIKADYALQMANGNEAYCGNITLNEYLKIDGSLTFDPKALELKGKGKLYLETTVPHFHGSITLFEGDFLLDGDMTELIKESGWDKLKVAGLDVKIKKLKLLGNGVQVGGSLQLPGFWGKVSADISNLQIVDGQIDVKGKINLPEMDIGVIALRDPTVAFDTLTDTFKGSGDLVIPGLFTIEGSVGVKDGRLDQVGFGLSGLNLAIDASGFFIQRIYGELDGLTDLSSLKIAAETDIAGGPTIRGISAIKAVDLRLEVDMSGHVTASGTLKLVELVQLYGEVTFNWAEHFTHLTAELSAFGIISGSAELQLEQGAIWGSASASVKIPEKVPMLRGKTFSSLNLTIDPKGFEGKVKVADLARATCEIDWEGDIDCDVSFGRPYKQAYRAPVFAAAEPFVAAQPGTEFVVPAGADQAIVLLTWDTGDADFSLTAPDGRVINPADAPMTSATIRYEKNAEWHEALYAILNPMPGTWKHTVTTRGANSYQVELLTSTPEPAIQVTAPAANVTGAGPVAIRWQTDAPVGSKVSLFYVPEGRSLGNLIAADLDAALGTYTWSPAGLSDGSYQIYALLDDGRNAPVRADAPGRVSVTNPGTPAVPRGLTVRAANGGLDVSWTENAEPDVAGYRLHLLGSSQKPVAVGRVSRYTWKGLPAGQSYQVAISAFDTEGLESRASAPVTVFLAQPAPPALQVIWPAKSVTREETIHIGGQIEAGATGRLYRDDELLADGLTGQFDRSVTLLLGENRLRLVATKPSGDQREESRVYVYDSIRPPLTVNGLTAQMTTDSPELLVSGTVGLGAELTLNGRPVAVRPDGGYALALTLVSGDNPVLLVASDEAGNETTFQGTVRYTGAGKKNCGTLFPDLPSTHASCRAVEKLAGLKVLSGYPDGTFQPERSVTRAEFAKMLVVALGRTPEPGSAVAFKDAGNHWGAKNGYLQAAVSLKAISGYPDGTFLPDAKVTRAQVVKIVAAAAGLTPAGTPPYADVPADAWYVGWVTAARKANLIGPASPLPLWAGTLFAGDEPATRAEAATILFNLLSLRE